MKKLSTSTWCIMFHKIMGLIFWSSGKLKITTLTQICLFNTSIFNIFVKPKEINFNFFLKEIQFFKYQKWWNSYFLHWNFDKKSCFAVFFLEWNEWKISQFNFWSQNLSTELNFFKWDGKVIKIWHLLFHSIWKN